MHNSNWGSISTISVSLNGAPFSMVTSFSDGTVDNSTGIPYFYLAATDPVVMNIKVNQWASLSLSEAQSDYCKTHDWDTEEPLCSRVTLTGKVNLNYLFFTLQCGSLDGGLAISRPTCKGFSVGDPPFALGSRSFLGTGDCHPEHGDLAMC